MSETQYNNLINIITNYPQMPVSQVFNEELSENNIMAALFSNTFTVGEGVTGYFLKYKYTDAYSDLLSKVTYYNNNMVNLGKARYDFEYVKPAIYCPPVLSGEEEDPTCKAIREGSMGQSNKMSIGPAKNKSIVDMDISYFNTQNIIKYYFLLDLLSEFYGYLAKNRATNKITIRSRYTIVNGEWAIIPTGGVFTFDIQFQYATMAGVSNYAIVNAQGEDIKVVTDMCDVFKNDIVRHLNYLNKEDITQGNKEYLQNLEAFYKFCRLKTVYYTLLCAAEINESVNDFINQHVTYCFLNLKNSIPMKVMDSQSMALSNQMMISTAKLQDYNLNIGKKNDVVKKNRKIRKTYENYSMKIVFYAIILVSIIFTISAYVIYNYSDQNRSDNFIAMIIIALTIAIYVIMHYFVKINTIERFETTTTASSGLKRFPITPATKNKYQSVGSKGNTVNIQIKGTSSIKVNDQFKIFDTDPYTEWANDYTKYTPDDAIINVTYNHPNVASQPRTSFTTSELKKLTEYEARVYYNITKSNYTFNVDEFIMIDLGEKVSIMGYNIKTLKLDYSPKTFKLLATDNASLFAADNISISSNYDIEPYDNNKWVLLHDESNAKYILGDNQFYSSINFEMNYRTTQHPIVYSSHISNDGTLNTMLPPQKINSKYYYVKFDHYDRIHDIKVLSDIECDILVVGGGGSGGTKHGGGGGGGAVIYKKNYKLKRGNYEFVIGKGGEGVPTGPAKCGNNGEDTTIKNKDTGETIFRAKGGGGGGGGISVEENLGKSGGSSGGSSVQKERGNVKDIDGNNIPKTDVNGNQGGYGVYGEYFINTDLLGAGGGGGGAGSVGGNCFVRYNLRGLTVNGGNGGDGFLSDITGTNEYYGGGGGGGIVNIGPFNNKGLAIEFSVGKGGKGGGGQGNISYTGFFRKHANIYNNPNQQYIYDEKIYFRDYDSYIALTNIDGALRTNPIYPNNITLPPDTSIYEKNYAGDIFYKGKFLALYGNNFNINNHYQIVKSFGNKVRIYGYDTRPVWTGSIYVEQFINVYNPSQQGIHDVSKTLILCHGGYGTGGGGGGGGIINLGDAKTDEEGNNSNYNSHSGHGGSGTIIIRYNVEPYYVSDSTPYRYYALVVKDSINSIANLKISELELFGGTEKEMDTYSSSYQFYKDFVNKDIEISSELQSAIDKAKAKLQEKIDIEKANADTIKSLKDQLANINTSNYMDGVLDKINQETLAKELEAAEAQARIDAAETARARDELLANEQKQLKEQIIAQQQILQDQIDTLKNNLQTLRDLENMILNPGNGSNLLNKLQQELAAAELAKTQAENRLAIAKAQEAADKLLIDNEKAINADYANQLSEYVLSLAQARKRKEDAIAAKQALETSYTQATVLQQQIVDAEVEAAEAEERKQNQIYLTNQARLATEAKQALADVRKQVLDMLNTQLSNLIEEYNTTENNILLILQQNAKIEYDIKYAVEYTSNYLIASSNEYIDLESTRNATIQALESDIVNITRDIATKLENIKVNIENTIQDREASEDIRKNLTNLAMELANYMIEKQNYKYGTNALSVTKTTNDIKTKMSVNIQTTMTQIANNIVLAGMNREIADISVQNDGSIIAAERSRGDVEEMRRDNLITVATCKFILNLFVLSVILMMIHQKFSLSSLLYFIVIIYIVLFVLYIMEVLRIVHTRSFNKYWQKPGQRQFL